jgi:hypothetical protein
LCIRDSRVVAAVKIVERDNAEEELDAAGVEVATPETTLDDADLVEEPEEDAEPDAPEDDDTVH